jgi:neutral ceramidase
MYRVGIGKADITAFVKGVGMLGYGIYYNTMEGVETPLSARTYIFEDLITNKKITYVNCELCFITIAIKRGVLKELQRNHPEWLYDEDNLMLTAQHTHSGPSGYSYYGLYNLSTPGFSIEVYHKIVSGIVESIEQAENNKQNARLSLNTGTFSLDKEVGFNRSVKGYNLNPEVKEKITWETANKGIDREMTLLKITDENGNPLGSINWFGVHTTSVANTNHKVCYDNKGYASAFLEQHFADKGLNNYSSVFAQGSCGDVTPRFTYNPVYPFQRGQWEGKYKDDFESARYNGKLQYEKALEIHEDPKSFIPVEGGIDYELLYVNFADVTSNPKYSNGNPNAQTGNPTMGIAFFEGTMIDGPGMHRALGFIMRGIIKFIKHLEKFKANFGTPEYKKVIERKYRVHGKKDILIESASRRVLGTAKLNRIPIPGWMDPAIATFKFFYKKVGHLKKPWTPKILPLQLFIVGDVALAGLPFEITTIAGQRLRKSLEETLAARGVKRVILSPYANGYSGYITTYEEYQGQIYEGGHTVFGEWSLAALQTKFDVLAQQMLKPKEERNIPHDAIPPDFTEEELNQFPFYKRAWYVRQELIRARRLERKGIHYDPFHQ